MDTTLDGAGVFNGGAGSGCSCSTAALVPMIVLICNLAVPMHLQGWCICRDRSSSLKETANCVEPQLSLSQPQADRATFALPVRHSLVQYRQQKLS